MADLYDRADIYDLAEDENSYKAYKKHWEAILKNRKIETLFDVSIGSGSVTLPAAELGIRLTGSDLSESMLANCRKKANTKQIGIELECCDFRMLSTKFSRKFDCVASTGNSLPHVNNKELLKVLEQMDALVNPNGYLYFDMRNWDKILREKNRCYLYNPFFKGDTRINLVQVWDYHEESTITFNLLYTFEKDNQIFQKEKFQEEYFPVKRQMLLDKLQKMGYEGIEIMNFPACFTTADPMNMDWYCIIAKKCAASKG